MTFFVQSPITYFELPPKGGYVFGCIRLSVCLPFVCNYSKKMEDLHQIYKWVGLPKGRSGLDLDHILATDLFRIFKCPILRK